MDTYEISEKVETMLRDNHISAEVWPYSREIPVVVVSIHWGDWKHDHMRAKWLCQKHGGVVFSSVETEENGSDCYSAEHTIAFVEGYKEVLDEASDF